MRLWTIQGIEIFKQLEHDGIAYCAKPLWGDKPIFVYAYKWMSEQMRLRIGEPPVDGIDYPMWAWFQYDSAKKRKPPRSPKDIPEGISAYMEIEVPDNEVLLSDFNLWHAPLNQSAIIDWKHIGKDIDKLEKEAGRLLSFDEYPTEIRDRIEKSWEAIFDLELRNRDVGRRHKRNRSIQATFWALKKEHIVSVEFLKCEGNVVKRIPSYE